MLLELFQWLATKERIFNVFQYITLRVVLAAMTALLISFIVGPAMIRRLTAYKIGQSVRDDGPQTHLIKMGTPTMGGALILVSVAVTTLLWADLQNRYVWIALLTTLGFGAVGWIDDWRKVVHRNPKGLSARAKLFWQSVIAIAAVMVLAYSAKLPQQTELIVPFFKTIAIPLGAIGFVILGYFVVVGTSNAPSVMTCSRTAELRSPDSRNSEIWLSWFWTANRRPASKRIPSTFGSAAPAPSIGALAPVSTSTV